MSRLRRLKVVGGVGYYHIISRIVGREYVLGDVEKEKLLHLIQHYSSIYFVRVIGFCIMSNHFHLLIKMELSEEYSESDVLSRLGRFRRIPPRTPVDVQNVTRRLEDVSEYVRSIKQSFSRWYNKVHDRSGYLWGDRFKSVLLESGAGLLHCLAYIDLNPIRAGLVSRPEDYRWCGLSYYVNGGNREDLLDLGDIYDISTLGESKVLCHYREYVYSCGSIAISPTKGYIPSDVVLVEESLGFELPRSVLFLRRIRYFSDGLAIGSKSFLKGVYRKFGGSIIHKKNRHLYKIGINDSILSVRNLTGVL